MTDKEIIKGLKDGAFSKAEIKELADNVMELTCEVARHIPRIGAYDNECEVTCYGKTERWESSTMAIRWFTYAAMCCDGCEAERYHAIADWLRMGLPRVTDNSDENFRIYERYTRVSAA